MTRSINFVQNRTKKLSQVQLQDKKYLRFATFGLIGAFVVFAVVIGFRLYLNFSKQELEQRQEAARTQLLAQESTERSYTIFSRKLGVLSQLFDKRKDKQEAIAYFSTVFGPSVIVKEIEYEQTAQTLTFGLVAKDVFTLQAVYDLFASSAFTERYASVQKSGLRRDQSGSYSMNVVVNLEKS